MKKKILAILLCIVSIIALSCGSIIAYADSSVNIDTAKFEQYAAELNKTLADNGTTADEQLERLSIDLTTQISQTTDSNQIAQFTKLNIVTDELRTRLISTYSTEDIIDGMLNLALSGLNEVARASVLSFLSPAIGLLKLFGHDLTVELLVNSLLIQEVDEPYIPAYGYKVKQSQLFKDIANGQVTAGGAEFPNAIWGTDGDLYLAIHGFKYSKTSSLSKTVIMTDKYDYDDSEEGLSRFKKIFHPVIRGMCLLERAGLATFYDIEITEALAYSDISFNDATGYVEKYVTVGANELIDIEVKPSNSGVRLVQTFGQNNTMLYILDSNGATLASACGNGYGGNSLISYNFNKDKNYIIRIRLNDKTNSGTVRLSVFYDSRNIGDFSELNLPSLSLGTYTAETTVNNLYIAEFIPTVTQIYKVTFADNAKFSAILIGIDDEDTYVSAYNFDVQSNGTNGEDSGKGMNKIRRDPTVSVIFPGGGSSDSKVMEKTLTAGRKYLLIAGGYPVTSSGLNIAFTISA